MALHKISPKKTIEGLPEFSIRNSIGVHTQTATGIMEVT
eukprot:COSAG02_NODE_4116_length_5753_cov_17.846657_1_plen_38_part_10